MHTKKVYFAAASAALLVILGLAILLSSSNNGQNTRLLQNSDAPTRMTIEDIEAITVHSGLDIPCPEIEGLGGHGYVYTVTLTEKRGILERVGCGIGTPETYAQAIAEDLYNQELFGVLNPEEVFEKLSFKLYELNTEN